MNQNTNDKLRLVYPELNLIGDTQYNKLYFPFVSKNYYVVQETIFGFIYKGIPSSYSNYLRSGIGYNTDETEVLENVYMKDVSEGYLKYFNYSGSDEFVTTVNTNYLTLRNEDNGLDLAYKPFTSDLSTDYGSDGLFSGVDSNNAFGKISITKFKTKSISSQQNILLTSSDISLVWIEATTGLVKASDGTNTCESSEGIEVDINYNIDICWDDNAFWIVLNGIIGQPETFTGSFPTIGEFLKYSEDGIYHTVRNVLLTNQLTDVVLRDESDVPLLDENDEILF